MWKWVIYLIGMGLILPLHVKADRVSAKVCTPEWEFYTQRDGNGLYHDIWRRIYTDKDVGLDFTFAVYSRCMLGLSDEENYFDIVPACYVNDAGLKSDSPLGREVLTIVSHVDQKRWTEKSDFTRKIVTWERGFMYQQAGLIPDDAIYVPYSSLERGLKMLLAKRVDYLVDYKLAVQENVRLIDKNKQLRVQEDVIVGPHFYMCFADTDKGRELLRIWNKGFAGLIENGELDSLYNQYGVLPFYQIP
ncbi:transporter substrate-binding domain-containing protein [Aestuariibacter sp. AA17]|uniref:Transporter substrate-binding domain-containing protein n=1 Tax=Fluctibacter corallii TaxID=2984329 RepID=A0ABT3A7I2_9ALTE|nr:transporter substrate-binding domain-containing protein [Aestuariibacter sp. AA17]MCV2884570.1 transporter substrate-binding domain-containing protein [Aestuariibacter sp. AA17]